MVKLYAFSLMVARFTAEKVVTHGRGDKVNIVKFVVP